MTEQKLPEFWKTYVAFVAVAALAAYIFLVENKREPAGDEAPKAKVFTLDKAKVQEIAVAHEGGETLRVKKDGPEWRLVEPIAVKADGPAVESLLSTLAGAEIQHEAGKDAAKLARYGLEKPRLRATLLAEGAKDPVVLLIGDKLVDGSGVYAKLADQPAVFTLGSFVESGVDKKAFDLRDRDVLKVKRDEVTTLDVQGPEGSYTLARDGKGEWAFTKPLATSAGRWSVDGLLGSLENLRMDSVAAESATDLKPFGLDKPARAVTLGLADGSARILEIGAQGAEKKYPVRVRGEGPVVMVQGALVDELAKGMNNLRQKRLLEVAAYDVTGIEVSVDAAAASYERSSTKDKDGLETSKWKKTKPEAKDLETSKVEDALFKIGGVEAVDFVDAPKADAEYGLDHPAFHLALKMGEGKGATEVTIGRKGDSVFARRGADRSLLKLDKAKADELIEAFKGL
jgi:hypothetical protein